ncbi:MAG: hypothetical protein WAU88_05025 [Candidatus Zixiibacteriota bacterium]
MIVRRALAVLGAILIAVGVFMPILGIPVFHDQSIMQLRPNAGWILLGLAVVTVLIVLTKKLGLLYVPGILAVVLLSYTLVAMQGRRDRIQSDIKSNVANTPVRGLVHGFVGSASLRFGWPLMMLGAVTIVAVPLVGSRMQRRRKEEEPAQIQADTKSGVHS